MNDIIIAIVVSIPPTIMAAAAFFHSRKTHRLVNNRMTELLKLTKEKAVSDEKKAERKRRKNGKPSGR